MEDILTKNIFMEDDLFKLSPDYIPNDINLRLQMRRTMVKDTHTHSVSKNNNWQRKTIKRTRNSAKPNRELMNIKNEFDNLNLKNQIMLKNSVKIKQGGSLQPKNHSQNHHDYELPNIDLDELTKDMTNLAISNDSNFKILNNMDKPKVVAKVRKDKKDHSKKCKDQIDKLIEAKEEVLRIECKLIARADYTNNENKDDSTHLGNDTEIKEYRSTSPPRNVYKHEVHDLQTLLIMMGLSPKSNDSPPGNSSTADFSEVYPTIVERETNQQNVTWPEDITEILNITPIKVEIDRKQKEIVKKYVSKWRTYVNKRKEFVNQQRQVTLNSFFDKLTKKKTNNNQALEPVEKAKLNVKDYTSYQHRYKVQRHIIALQKAKLEEQSRVIEELKYNRIIEASKNSVDAMKEEVRKTYYELDRHLKPKIKCLTNELKMHDIEEPSLILHCLKVPQFLKRMEKRAREREEKHARIRERRRQMEEERLRIKQQEELAKAEMDKEEKARRIKELREKRKREKVEAIRKKQHAERIRALTVMAELHYEKNLMEKYGIRPLRLLIQIKRYNLEKAKEHHKFQLKKNVFLNWMWHTEDMWFERNFKAEDFNRKRILKRVFKAFKQTLHELVLKKQVAEDYYDLYVMQFAFRKYRQAIDIVRKENDIKWQRVVEYHNGNLLFKTFTCWRTLPALNALQREQEFRKARWRKKVLQVVPDYVPPED